MKTSSETKYRICSRNVVDERIYRMQEAGVGTVECGQEIVGRKQYSSKIGSARR